LGFLAYAEGSNFGIWSSVLHALGGWNEGYAGGGDDLELSWRAQLAGYRLAFARDAVIRYRYRPALLDAASQMFRYGLNEHRLRRDFARHGMPEYGLDRRTTDLLRFMGRAWHVLASRRQRGQWVCTAAYGAGRLWGGLMQPSRHDAGEGSG
jgi:GT2 family glycosyltransferase